MAPLCMYRYDVVSSYDEYFKGMNCGWWLLLLLEQWLYSNQAFYTNFLCWKYQMFLGFYGTPAQFTLVESLLELLLILKEHISLLFLYLYLVELSYGLLTNLVWQQNWLLTSKNIPSMICIVYQKQIGGRFQNCKIKRLSFR